MLVLSFPFGLKTCLCLCCLFHLVSRPVCACAVFSIWSQDLFVLVLSFPFGLKTYLCLCCLFHLVSRPVCACAVFPIWSQDLFVLVLSFPFGLKTCLCLCCLCHLVSRPVCACAVFSIWSQDLFVLVLSFPFGLKTCLCLCCLFHLVSRPVCACAQDQMGKKAQAQTDKRSRKTCKVNRTNRVVIQLFQLKTPAHYLPIFYFSKTGSIMGRCHSDDHITKNHIHTDITTCYIEEPQQKYRFGTKIRNRLPAGIYFIIIITRITINNNTPHLKSPQNPNRRAALGRPAMNPLP